MTIITRILSCNALGFMDTVILKRFN